jgi:hypothetical protein
VKDLLRRYSCGIWFDWPWPDYIRRYWEYEGRFFPELHMTIAAKQTKICGSSMVVPRWNGEWDLLPGGRDEYNYAGV